MPSPASLRLARAEQFVWLTARVLEQRRFAFHFRSRPADGVRPRAAADALLTALDAYRNPDGGYGHALEPDLRGPVSQPLHAAYALRVLTAAERCTARRAEQICRYLGGVSTPEGALPAVHPSQRGYPSAPWAPVADDPPSSLLATGPVVGLLRRSAVWHAWLFRATDFCWRAVEALDRTHPHAVQAAIAFLDGTYADGTRDRDRAVAAAERLGGLVRGQRLAVLDPDREPDHPLSPGYPPGDHHYAYDFARTPDSLARAWFSDEEMERALDHLAELQQADGGWPAHGRTWAPGTELEWRPVATIEALLTLTAYGRLTD